ncbi:hypothetical protein [Nostoc sp.]
MLIELTDSAKKLFKETASQLKGAARQRFQAQVDDHHYCLNIVL